MGKLIDTKNGIEVQTNCIYALRGLNGEWCLDVLIGIAKNDAKHDVLYIGSNGNYLEIKEPTIGLGSIRNLIGPEDNKWYEVQHCGMTNIRFYRNGKWFYGADCLCCDVFSTESEDLKILAELKRVEL